LQRLVVTGLANDALDFDQIPPVLDLPTKLQRIAQQNQTLQFLPRTDELPVRITHQVEIAQQHGNEEQYADQTEFHGETQPVHQCDGRT